jgi:hypothetical protein
MQMPVSMLSKGDLIALILAEIRKRKGCAGVEAVVIQENRHPRSAANWEISILAASSGDPSWCNKPQQPSKKACSRDIG